MTSNQFFIEVTDTFGGEANYCWVRRYLVTASTIRGAISKLAKRDGGGWKRVMDSGDFARFNLDGSCVCAFVSWSDGSEAEQYSNVDSF